MTSIRADRRVSTTRNQITAPLPPMYRTPASALLDDLDSIYKDVCERAPFEPKPLSEAMGGGLGPEFMLLKAPGGEGKTDLVINIAVSVAENKKVLISSREISKQACMKRIIGCVSCLREGGKPLTENEVAHRTKATEERRANIDAAIEAAKRLCNNIVITDDGDLEDESDRCIEELVSVAKSMAKADGAPPVVILDYVQLVTTSQNVFSATDVLDKISRALATLAHHERTPVIAITTMGKDGTIRGTAQLGFDADIVLDLRSRPNTDGSRTAKITLEKFRNGLAGQVVELLYQPAYHFFGPIV